MDEWRSGRWDDAPVLDDDGVRAQLNLNVNLPDRVVGRDGVPPAFGVADIRSAVAAFRESVARGEKDRLAFGIPLIDRAMRGGVERGELAILLGRTESLKTMLVQNVLRRLVKQWSDDAFLFVELEMPQAQLIRRLLRMEYNRNDALLDGAIASGAIDLDRFCTAFRHLYFVDEGGITLAAIEEYATTLARRIRPTRLKGLVIDHAGLIRGERGSSSAYDRATETAIGLKQLARKLDLAVFCIVQANRAGVPKDGEPVSLESARDSGAFEENADFVLAFSQVTEPPNGQPFVKVRLAKNRRGPHVPAVIVFDPHSLKMFERDEAGRDGD